MVLKAKNTHKKVASRQVYKWRACVDLLRGQNKIKWRFFNMAVITMKQLLEAGVHFGHHTRRWNPKMKEYIFNERNGVYILIYKKQQIRLKKHMLQWLKLFAIIIKFYL